MKDYRLGLQALDYLERPRPALLGRQHSAVEPDFEKFPVARQKFVQHRLATGDVFLLRLGPDSVVAFGIDRPRGFSASDAKEPVIVHCDIEPWQEAVFACAVHEVAYEVALAAAPLRLLHAVGVYITLPLHETGAVLRRQNDVLCAERLRRLHPLVGIEFFGVVEIRVGSLAAAENRNIVMEEHSLL